MGDSHRLSRSESVLAQSGFRANTKLHLSVTTTRTLLPRGSTPTGLSIRPKALATMRAIACDHLSNTRMPVQMAQGLMGAQQ
jgi:hypothetical protein